jgi:hypothetical protein
MDYSVRRWMTCDRKKGSWATYKKAAESALKIFRRNKDLMTPYKCEFCDKYHIGHESKYSRARV